MAVNRRLDALSRLKSAAPTAVIDRAIVEFDLIPVHGGSVASYHPGQPNVDLPDWAATEADAINAQLLRHGALLFRGFDIREPQRFERFCRALCADLYADNGEHPRGSISENVYTPVFYPPEKRLIPHNENSFNMDWPRIIWFCCVQPAATGGETPIADSRKVYDGIDAALRGEFERKGVMYVRNYGEGIGLDWETVFQTHDRGEVEGRCAEAGMQFDWKPGNVLKTSSVRPAAIPHPITGEMSWFNQAQHFHVACLDADTRKAIEAVFKPDDFPRSCCFGDGSPIPDDAMRSILSVYDSVEYSFPWQPGDVLMVDNVLSAHARNAFTGERKLLVALGDMRSY